MFQAFGWYDCADGKRNKALSTCFSLTPVYPRDKTEMHRGSIYLERIVTLTFLNLSIYLDQSHIDFSPHFQMFLSDFKCSLPKKNRESGHAPLPFWEIFCFLFTEFDFCIFVNDHFAGRREEVGQGKEVRASIPVRPQCGAKSLVSKFHISSLDTRRRGREMGGSFLSGESLVG